MIITLGRVQTAAETHFSAWPASAAMLTACSWLRHVLRYEKGSWQPVGLSVLLLRKGGQDCSDAARSASQRAGGAGNWV